ncbi:unnamed protein product [Notodromas monacha]|uniref:Uncharacterized protein n=1 Tax=Notodromas monacha TaxID=399045 RepID=A0A7R9BDT0_9CRUS|nr:unnamed protein product [Notodromas monacha]CAG0913468.1 unnamed protein product [Notodromas monacha]
MLRDVIQLVNSSSEFKRFQCSLAVVGNSGEELIRRSEIKLFCKDEPTVFSVRLAEQLDDGQLAAVYFAQVTQNSFASVKKRFQGSMMEFINHVSSLLESCAGESSARILKLTQQSGLLHLEVTDLGTFRPVSLISLPCSRASVAEALEALLHDLDKIHVLSRNSVCLTGDCSVIQWRIRAQCQRDEKLDEDILSKRGRYEEEMKNLRYTEDKLRKTVQEHQAEKNRREMEEKEKSDEKRRREYKKRKHLLRQEESRLEKCKTSEAALNRKAEMVALERAELEDQVRSSLRERTDLAEEGRKRGLEETEVVKEEIKNLQRQIDADKKVLSDLEDQIEDLENKCAQLKQVLSRTASQESAAAELLQKRTTTVKKLGIDLLSLTKDKFTLQGSIGNLLSKIESLERFSSELKANIDANELILKEAHQHTQVMENVRQQSAEAAQTKLREDKVAELEKELKINRDVITLMDRKLEMNAAKKSFELEDFYCAPVKKT